MLSVTVMLLFSACGREKKSENSEISVTEETAEQALEYPEMHSLYFKDSNKSAEATATFFNSVSGKSENVEMKKISEDSDSFTFSCEGNCALYNMAYITSGDKITKNFAFNPCVSGWYKTDGDFLPYTVGEEINYSPKLDMVTLTGHGYEKDIYIRTPDDYDADSAEKYSTVYVIDGQFLMYLGKYGQILKDCAVVTEQVKAMNAAAGQKTILVGIDNVGMRDYELVPDIGDSVVEKDFESKNGTPYEDEFDCMDGTEFADFVANTLVPYVQQHYNVHTDALHTAIAGASLGGLESFYIGVEYPEIFGACGALTPSFWEFESATWEDYLKTKDFQNSSQFIYLYTGPDESDIGPRVTEMYNRLLGMGYPGDKLAIHFDKDGGHGGMFWRCVFSEFLTATVYGQIKPLQ